MGTLNSNADERALYHARATGSNGIGFKALPDILTSDSAANPPKTWVLLSRHAGDNTQLLALMGALGWPYETKRLAYKPYEEVLRLSGLATLAGVDLSQSSPLGPPWPALIICSGRSTEAVAFWIRRHGNPGVKIVFIGTPWASPDRFDLIITTPQYRLPKKPNILHNTLPLHGHTEERLKAEAQAWQARLSHLPSPRIAVLVGGSSGPYRFEPDAAARLGRDASRIAAAPGGSLLVTTSARTSPEAADALEAAITVPSFFHRWNAEGGGNPFSAFLGLADEIIVTADSISMLAEAIASGKPVHLFDIDSGPQSMRAEDGKPSADGAVPPIHWRGRDPGTTLFRLLMRHAPPRWSRDLRIVHRQVIAEGLATWLGETPHPPRPHRNAELAHAAARIRQLFGL